MKRHPALRAWLGIFLALEIADSITTYVALHLGAPEGSPLYSFLFAHTSFAAATLVKVVAVACICAYIWLTSPLWPRVALWETIGLCAWMLLVVGENMRVVVMVAS